MEKMKKNTQFFDSFGDFSAVSGKKLAALTFDDGPNTTTTAEVLDLLEFYGIRATFFLIGENISAKSAELVKRAVKMGCEMGNHSKSHPAMNSLSAEEIKAEIAFVNERIYEIAREYPRFFRPPYIAVNRVMCESIDMPFIGGFGCEDYNENITALRRAEALLNCAKDGVIFLLHDFAGNYQTVKALEIVIPQLIAQNYEFVTLSELFERKGIVPENGKMYDIV